MLLLMATLGDFGERKKSDLVGEKDIKKIHQILFLCKKGSYVTFSMLVDYNWIISFFMLEMEEGKKISWVCPHNKLSSPSHALIAIIQLLTTHNDDSFVSDSRNVRHRGGKKLKSVLMNSAHSFMPHSHSLFLSHEHSKIIKKIHLCIVESTYYSLNFDSKMIFGKTRNSLEI